MPDNKRPHWPAFLSTQGVLITLTVLSVFIYSNTFKSSFVFDDFAATGNQAIRHLNLPILWQAFNTRFVVGVTLALNYWLGKENVVGYHLFNTLVHILNSYLVYILVCLTFKTPRMSKSVSVDPKVLGFLTALLFLSHPLQTQAVTYIWQRATSLASFFYLGALVFYIRTRLKFSPLSYGLCLLCTVLGMFTKEIVFTLPLAMGLYELIFLRQLPLKTIQRVLLWVPLLLTLLIVPWTMTKANEKTLGLVRPNNIYFNPNHQKVNLLQDLWKMTRTASTDEISRGEFILTELNVLRTYLRLFLLPVNQNVDYDYPRVRSLLEPNTLISFLLLTGLLGLGLILLKNYPLLSFGIFWFFLTVSMESLVAQENFIFEHRLYLPMVGLSLFFVMTGYHFFKNNPLRLTIILLGIITCYSFLTYERNFVWKDEFTLWDDAVHKSPKKARPYNNRGYAYQKIGRVDRALADYNKAIEIKPDYVDAYGNRASVYGIKGLLDKAMVDINKAIALDPVYAIAYSNRGAVDVKSGLFSKALLDFNKAIQLKPDCAEFYSNRGEVYNKMGQMDQALLDFNKAIELEPNYAIAYDNRGCIYGMKEQFDQALLDFNKAIELSPNFANAYYNRANLYFLKKEYNKSWQDLRKAQSLGFVVNPQFIEKLKKVSGRNE